MNRVIELESSRIIGVLESAVQALQLLALVPFADADQDDQDQEDQEDRSLPVEIPGDVLKEPTRALVNAHMDIEASYVAWLDHPLTQSAQPEDDDDLLDVEIAFAKSLHQIVRLLEHDKSACNALRKHCGSRSPSTSLTKFLHAWTDVVIQLEHTFSTTTEQDERTSIMLRDSKLRLREVEDDKKQVAFELLKEKEARVAMNTKYLKIIHTLKHQLRETERYAADALATNDRIYEHEHLTATATFEMEKTNNHEKMQALDRMETRASEMHSLDEADERKRKLKLTNELHELIKKYDRDMLALDQQIVDVQHEIQCMEADTTRLMQYFERIDEDRRNQLDEIRILELAELMRRRKDLNLFKFIQRLQASVRGFLARKRWQQSQSQSKPNSKKKKKKAPTKKKSTIKKTT